MAQLAAAAANTPPLAVPPAAERPRATHAFVPTLLDIGPDGLALIEHCESLRLRAYQDPVGIWTIGYGAIRGLDGLPVNAATPPLTLDQAQAVLKRDCATAVRAIQRLITTPLTQHQFDALCSFTFNLGSGALQASTLRQCIQRGDHEQAAQQFQKWSYAKGVKLPGLVKRRLAESILYSGGWPDILGPRPEMPPDPDAADDDDPDAK
jgi:lysozyme